MKVDYSLAFNSIPIGEEAKTPVLQIAANLRQARITTEIAFGDRSLKGAMKAADKAGARFVIVVGATEVETGSVDVKRMEDGVITSVKIDQLPREISSLLSGQRS